MNGWVLAIAIVLVLVVALRSWFRWFSRRPLSTVDRYAGVVDTDVDAADTAVRADPPPRPAPAGPAATGRPSGTVRPTLPQQRSAADAGDAAPTVRAPAPPQQQNQ